MIFFIIFYIFEICFDIFCVILLKKKREKKENLPDMHRSNQKNSYQPQEDHIYFQKQKRSSNEQVTVKNGNRLFNENGQILQK